MYLSYITSDLLQVSIIVNFIRQLGKVLDPDKEKYD